MIKRVTWKLLKHIEVNKGAYFEGNRSGKRAVYDNYYDAITGSCIIQIIPLSQKVEHNTNKL